MSQTFRRSHSTQVKLWLDCGDHGLVDLGRVTPTSIVAKDPRDIPACEAELVVSVDGQIRRNRVCLFAGLSQSSPIGLVSRIDEVAPF